MLDFWFSFIWGNDSHHSFIPVPSLKASMPQRDFVSELLLFFSLQKQTYTSMHTFRHFKSVLSKVKKFMSFSSGMFERSSWIAQSRQQENETLQDVGRKNTNTGTDYACWLSFFPFFLCHESHMSTCVRQCACEWQKIACLALGLPLLMWQMDRFFRGVRWGGQLWQWGT